HLDWASEWEKEREEMSKKMMLDDDKNAKEQEIKKQIVKRKKMMSKMEEEEWKRDDIIYDLQRKIQFLRQRSEEEQANGEGISDQIAEPNEYDDEGFAPGDGKIKFKSKSDQDKQKKDQKIVQTLDGDIELVDRETQTDSGWLGQTTASTGQTIRKVPIRDAPKDKHQSIGAGLASQTSGYTPSSRDDSTREVKISGEAPLGWNADWDDKADLRKEEEEEIRAIHKLRQTSEMKRMSEEERKLIIETFTKEAKEFEKNEAEGNGKNKQLPEHLRELGPRGQIRGLDDDNIDICKAIICIMEERDKLRRKIKRRENARLAKQAVTQKDAEAAKAATKAKVKAAKAKK
ncbi:MAG: hypothetical protein EZS28_005331, partial [Streblomastix strix]